MTSTRLMILNGPGLDDLSSLEGNDYGNITLQQIQQQCTDLCSQLNIELDFRQTDDQDEMFRFLARDSEAFDALIINPKGHSRATSVDFEMYHSAIMMIAHLNKPIIEVHITNIFKPGAEFTKPLQVPECELGFISGLGVCSYLTAIKAIDKKLH